jgi:tetratricopeptide (TPR) repeat protein
MQAVLRLERAFRVLPDVPELGALREALLGASAADPAMEWASAGRYVTFDKRVLDAVSAATIIDTARARAMDRVQRLYEGAARLLASALAGDDAAVVGELIQLGEGAEVTEDFRQAGSCYGLAATLSAPLSDRTWLVLSLRRLARVRLAAGELDEARTLYRAALDQAVAASDRIGRIVALTGIGNALSFKGQFAEARVHYEQGVLLCGDPDVKLRAQLHINLAMVAREQDRLDEAEVYLQQARAGWELLEAGDRSGWHNFAGLIALSRQSFEEAEAAFARALAEAPGSFERAMVTDNMTELAIQRRQFQDAAELGRRAEHHALAAGSPRALAEIYTRLGRLFRLRGDANGVTFFEKALELCRVHRYLLVEATAYSEYAQFRQMLGDEEEARAYSERADAILRELGASLDAN